MRPQQGILAYITSNSWLKAEYGKATRRYFSERHTPLTLLELGKDIFESAIVDSGVLMLQTGGNARPFRAVDMDRVKTADVPPAPELWGQVRPDGDAPWSILSATEQSIMDKMLAVGTPLKDWDIAINYGIKTGLNDAFIVDNRTKEVLIAEDPMSAEIIKPVLRGRDIQRYRANWAGLWLIDTHNGYGGVPAIDVDDYPAVKAHLDGYLPQLEKRHDKGRTPYNLRNCAYHADFAKEKLFWMDMSPVGRFAYSVAEEYCNDKGYIMTGGNLKYLCAVLNSSLITWAMKHEALTTGMGLLQWKKFAVERLPIPLIPTNKQHPFISLVDSVLDSKGENPLRDTQNLESEINRLVFELYELTEDEIQAVTTE